MVQGRARQGKAVPVTGTRGIGEVKSEAYVLFVT